MAGARAGAPVAGGRGFDRQPPKVDRARCHACGMPVRGSADACWSCGADPHDEAAAARREPTAPIPAPKDHGRITSAVLTALAVLALLLALLLAAVLLVPAEQGGGLRSLADRVRGEPWQRVELSGASVELPGQVSRGSVPGGHGLPAGAPSVVGVAGDRRFQLDLGRVAPADATIDGPAVAATLVEGYARRAGGRVARTTPVVVDGAAGLDAQVAVGARVHHVRAAVVAGVAYVLVADAAPGEVERFTGSLRRPA